MELKDRIKRLQTHLGVSADGIIGSQTMTILEKKFNLIDIPANNKTGKKVCICIGHSPKDKGAVSNDGKTTEYDYNSQLADIVCEECAKLGFTGFIVNRYTDGGGTSMTADIKAVNKYESNCIIELHLNAFNKVASGSETLYWHTSSNSKRLATDVLKEIVSVLNLKDRGIKAIESVDERGGAVLKGSFYPMIIVEPAFVDNDSDLVVIKTKIKELGKAIAKGLQNYLNG